MPIAVKDYIWEESDRELFITVPLKAVKAAKVDILSTEAYIKVSYPPYIFECLLYADVDDVTSSCKIGDGVVAFRLVKKEPEIWGRLHSLDMTDKEKLKEAREVAIERYKTRSEEQEKERKEKKRERDKYALKEQMRLEDEERHRIERVKEEERKTAMEEMERWKEQQQQMAEEEKRMLEAKKVELEKQRLEQQKLDVEQRKKEKRSKKKKNIFEAEAGDQPMREVGKIQVKFTPRVFPTPTRESAAPDEDEWLRKQAERRRIADIEDADLTEEEKNPEFMKDKGNQFFKAENYEAAVNAYSHAIRLNYKLPALYSNRGACHLKLRNFFKCVEDCSRALELLTPPVPQNAASRVKAHVRRGTAFCQLELYAEGLLDYEAASKIDPKNEQLQADAVRIRDIIQGTAPS